MAHIHSVYDTDAHFQIDGATRAVKNASTTKTIVIQHDHNSERFTFEIPRVIDGHDMSTCDVVQVHYINTDSSGKIGSYYGVYEVDDLQVSPDSDDVVICSWLISANATQYVGHLSFVIRFACTSDGVVDYAWNTAIHSGVYVSGGINNSYVVVEEYADVLERWRQELVNAGSLSDEDIANAVAEYLAENPVEAGATKEEAEQIRQNKDDIEKLNTDKLNASELPEAINTALAQAKASGEFNGSDGKDGADGKTPIKGTDYYTEADKQEIVEDVLAEMPEIPSGGGGDSGLSAIAEYELTEAASILEHSFETPLKNEMLLEIVIPSTESSKEIVTKVNGVTVQAKFSTYSNAVLYALMRLKRECAGKWSFSAAVSNGTPYPKSPVWYTALYVVGEEVSTLTVNLWQISLPIGTIIKIYGR